MFGHHEYAQAKVLMAEMVFPTWEEEHHSTYEFVLEVQPPNGQAFRAKTRHSFISFTPHPEVGDIVNVKYDPKSQKVELEVHGDNRYGAQGEKHREQAQRQAEQARRDALLSAPPGTPVSSSIASGSASMAGLDPELQELLQMEEAERRSGQAAAQPWGAQSAQTPGAFAGAGASVSAQAALALAESQALRQQLEYNGASGKAQILRKQQTGAPIDRYAPFFVEVMVHPDHHGSPFQCSFTTWIDISKGTLIEGYTIPVKYDPQNTSRIAFVLPV